MLQLLKVNLKSDCCQQVQIRIELIINALYLSLSCLEREVHIYHDQQNACIYIYVAVSATNKLCTIQIEQYM